jgi:hypothetical protein
MKKLIMSLLFVGLFGAGVWANAQEPPEDQHKATHNKVTKTTKNAGKKTAKGAKHGAYDVTHNKATEKTNINEGNEKYSNQNDINKEKQKDKEKY